MNQPKEKSDDNSLDDTLDDNIVSVRNIFYQRGSLKVFDGADIDIVRGKVTAIMGPSGCGKTTLLRLIGGQIRPDKGTVIFDGTDISKLGREELLSERRKMGMLFQSGALFTDLSVYENVAFPLRLHTKLSDAMIRELVLMKLQSVGLRGARNLMPSELSGGMTRRAALARAIILDPQLVMYDEPFSGQDPIFTGILTELIERLNDSMNLTSIVVSHDVTATARIADFIYVLANGKVIGHGTADEILNSADEKVHQFIRGLPDGPVPFHYPAKDYRSDLLVGDV